MCVCLCVRDSEREETLRNFLRLRTLNKGDHAYEDILARGITFRIRDCLSTFIEMY